MANLLPGGLPAGTALFAGICAAVFGVQYAFAVDTGPLAIGAFPVVFLGEWFRLASSAFLHGGILHILMNMASLLAMGPSVESILGTAQFVTLVLAAVLLEGLIYVCVCVGCWAVTSDAAWLHMYAVGFSGVLFTLAVEEASLSPNPTRSVFGLFRVPTRLYPWVLLVLLQFAIPNISFLGHLSGLLVGVLHVGGLLAWLLPSMESSRFLETLPVARALRANGMLCPTPSSDPVAEAARRAGANGTCFGTVALAFVALWQGVWPVLAWLWGGVRATLQCVGLGCCLVAVDRLVASVGRCTAGLCACRWRRSAENGPAGPGANAPPLRPSLHRGSQPPMPTPDGVFGAAAPPAQPATDAAAVDAEPGVRARGDPGVDGSSLLRPSSGTDGVQQWGQGTPRGRESDSGAAPTPSEVRKVREQRFLGTRR